MSTSVLLACNCIDSARNNRYEPPIHSSKWHIGFFVCPGATVQFLQFIYLLQRNKSFRWVHGNAANVGSLEIVRRSIAPFPSSNSADASRARFSSLLPHIPYGLFERNKWSCNMWCRRGHHTYQRDWESKKKRRKCIRRLRAKSQTKPLKMPFASCICCRNGCSVRQRKSQPNSDSNKTKSESDWQQ